MAHACISDVRIAASGSDYREYRLANKRPGSDKDVREWLAARDAVEPRKPISPEVARLLRARALAMMAKLSEQ